MATLDDFRGQIDAGEGACRVDAGDSVLVFRIDGSYYVGNLYNDQAIECLTWDEVLDNLGDWAQFGGWQRYRRLLPLHVVVNGEQSAKKGH